MRKIQRSAIQIVLCISMMAIPFALYSQNTVSLSVGAAVELTFVTPAEAGSPVLQLTNNNKWLNYHIVTPSFTPYNISVQLESALPEGLELKILAGPYQGTWGGSTDAPNRRGTKYTDNPAGDSPGIPSAAVALTLLPQVLVSNIGSFDTGIGAYVGHQLTYTLSISDYSKVRAANTQVNVTYTITQF